MAKHYTVLFIDDKGNPVRETLVSKRFLRTVSGFILMLLSLIGAGGYHYLQLHHAAADRAILVSKLDEQAAQVENQRRQIQTFAQDINSLKSSLMSLNDFEKKIRIFANLEHKPDESSLFAIGGSLPDDLDPAISVKQDHDRLMRQMHDHMDQVEQATTVQQNSFSTLLKSLKSKRNRLAATPSLRPTEGWISSNFGYRVSPFTGRREFHKGLDIATRKGTPIIAPADGIVTFSGKKWLMGNMVTMDHGYGMLTRYGHIHELLKKKGDRVKRGEVIALVGNTGRSTGPHLHYEVRLNGVPVNPIKYILD
jgi:murein DD-endopeptidase MepM/ murein hydrolase activator NlpD